MSRELPRDIERKVEGGERLTYGEAMTLLDLAQEVLERQKSLLKVKPPLVIVGDTHGDFETSLQVFERYKQKKVFLGDYVDRGERQLENVNFLLAKLIKGEAWLLRGNHESMPINYAYGFSDVLINEYSSYWMDLYVRYNEVFSLMPYAARVKGFLLVHGGVAKGVKKLKELEKLPRKDMLPKDQRAFQLLWNDPREEVEEFAPNTVRGEGTFFFGKKALKRFLKENGLKGLIRAHEPKDRGYEFMFKEEKGGLNGHLLLTVFSCRYYGITPAVAVYDGKSLRVENL